MHKNNNNHHMIPNTPPLSISLPLEIRHEPDPNSKLKPIPEPRPKPRPKPKPKPVRVNSPTRSESPLQNDTALVAVVEKYYSPLTSPLPATPPKDNSPIPALPPPPHHVINFSRHEEVPPQSGVVLGEGGGERKVRSGGGKKEDVVVKVGLLLRVLEIVLCLISFSVMASDKTQGWSGDSFDRYKEYRFCLTVAIFGFVYSAFQAYDLGSHLATGKHVITHRFRYQFDFLMDQIIAYLLISASSASASRVDNWQANWGKDEFTQKASASISMAFLAFICFATSSLISGHNLCNRDLH